MEPNVRAMDEESISTSPCRRASADYDDAKADVGQLTSATTNAGYPSAPKS
jgi:hypothetical protein